jgi:hypothetical protein
VSDRPEGKGPDDLRVANLEVGGEVVETEGSGPGSTKVSSRSVSERRGTDFELIRFGAVCEAVEHAKFDPWPANITLVLLTVALRSRIHRWKCMS